MATPITLIAGPQIMGMFFNWALQAVLSVQVYLYYLFFPQDPVPLKALVYGILCFEWVQTGLITAIAFDAYVYGYGDIDALTSFHNSWFSVPIMCSTVAAVVQLFFGWRIHILSESRTLAFIVAFLSFSQLGLGVAGGVLIKYVASAASASRYSTPVISTWLATSAFGDVFIAVIMTMLLSRARSGIPHSDDLINNLVRLVIETGTLTASVAIVDVIVFTTRSNTLLHECPALVLAKLYANTLLVNLNNRAFIRRGEQDAYLRSSRRPSFNSWPGFTNFDGTTAGSANAVRVGVLRETRTDTIPLDTVRKRANEDSHLSARTEYEERDDGKANIATVI